MAHLLLKLLMALHVFCGTFALSTAAAGNTQDVTDAGMAGIDSAVKAFILFDWNGRTATGQGEADHKFGTGYGVSSTDRGGCTSQSDYSNTTMATDSQVFDDACIKTLTITGTLDGAADFTSYITNGFRLTIDDAFPSAYLVGYIAIWSDTAADLGDVKSVTCQSRTGGTGTNDITTVGFQPDAAFVFAANDAAVNTATTFSAISFGVVDTALTNYVMAGNSDDNVGTSITQGYCKSGESMAYVFTDQVDVRTSISAWLSNGFTLNTIEDATTALNMRVLCVRGGQWKAFDGLTQTTTGAFVGANQFGFVPIGVIVGSACRAVSTADTTSPHEELSIGFCDGTNQNRFGLMDKDAATTADVGISAGTAAVYVNQSTATTIAVEGVMAVSSFDASNNGQITFDMTDADPSQNFFFGMVFAGSAAQNLTRTTTDAPTSSESLTRTGTFGRTSSESPTSSEVATQAAQRVKTTAESVSSSEVVTNVTAAIRVTSEAASLSESVVRIAQERRNIEDYTTTGMKGVVVSYWPLSDETDATGAERTLTNNGSVTFTTGKIGNAASFAGTTGMYLSRASDSGIALVSKSFGGSCWFKRAAGAGSVPTLMGKINEWHLDVTNNFATFTVSDFDATLTSVSAVDVTITDDTWHFVAFWRDRIVQKIYIQVDGGTIYSATPPNNIFNSSAQEFRIGDQIYFTNSPWKGLIDEAFLRQNIWSSRELTFLYNGGTGRSLSEWPEDLATQTANRPRTTTEALSSSESLSRVLQTARTVTQIGNTIEVGSRSLIAFRSASESASSSESITSLKSIDRTATESGSVADVAARLQTLPRTTTDAVSSSESVTAASLKPRTATDAPHSSDVASQTKMAIRTALEQGIASDTVTNFKTSVRTATDAPHSSESVVRTVSEVRTTTDAPHSTDAITRTGTFGRAGTDAVSSSESANAQKGLTVRSATDAVSSADVATRIGVFGRTDTDVVSSSEIATGIATKARNVTDAASVADAVTRTVGQGRTATDAPHSSDVAVRAYTPSRTASDSLSALDTAVVVKVLNRLSSEAVASADAVVASSLKSRTANDAPHSTDTATQLKTRIVSATDALFTSDAATRAFLGTRNALDSLQALDLATATKLSPTDFVRLFFLYGIDGTTKGLRGIAGTTKRLESIDSTTKRSKGIDSTTKTATGTDTTTQRVKGRAP